jgi:hypothetical protein
LNYRRTPEQLRKQACLYWPPELTAKEANTSVLPLLIQTQEAFISLLAVSNSSPFAWKIALTANKDLYANLFVKHLMVLADVGGEVLKRIRPELKKMFPCGSMKFAWEGSDYQYRFQEIVGTGRLDNVSLSVDGIGIQDPKPWSGKYEDIAMLLLFGGAANESIPNAIRDRCVIGNLIGNKAELDSFVRQRYIFVSRITGGATSNTMGQLAQDYVRELLQQLLPRWQFIRNGSLEGVSQNAGGSSLFGVGSEE